MTVALIGLTPSASRANHPATTKLENHWELLAETVTGVVSSKHIPIERGTLPAGTTKFDPQPTATLEVVARHTGGQGASRYDVKLRATGTTDPLAMVPFSATDTSYTLKTAALSWPLSNKPLSQLFLEKVNDGLNLAGTLDVLKATIKIRQSGTVLKTVSRLPLAIKQVAIVNTTWQDVGEPILYTHTAADFDPAPTAYFRTTGYEKTQNPINLSLHVRLIDSTEVVLAENVHSNHGSQTSAALSLVNGRTYRLQVRVDNSIPAEEGELHSADLVFEQSTSDTHGLTRTVAFFPSITAVRDLVTDGAWADFRLNAPELQAPEVAWQLSASLRRLTGTGTVRAAVQDWTKPHAPPPSVATTSAGTNATSQTAASLPTTVPGNDLDSKAILPVGATARVAQTLLRATVTLRDLFGPDIFFLTPLDRGNVAFSSVPLAAKLTDYLGIDSASIAFTLTDETAGTSQTFSGAQVAYDSATGWAKTATVSFATDHVYRLSVSARDVPGNLTTASHDLLADGGGFRAISPSPSSGAAHIDPTACAVSGGVATCSNVVLKVDPTTATLSGSRSRGRGQVLHTVSLENAIVRTTLPDGTPAQQSAYNASDPAWTPRTLRTYFDVRQPFATSTTFTTEAAQRKIGTLQVSVPSTWSSASLELNTESQAAIDACADATTARLVCVPDLVRVLPLAGTQIVDPDIRGLLGASEAGGSISAPISASAPSWFTDSFVQQVRDAGGQPVSIPGNNVPPFALTGIRPGTLVDVAGNGRLTCTANFIFSTTIAGRERKALGTAEHCTQADPVLRYLIPAPDPDDPDLYVSSWVDEVVFPRNDQPWPPTDSACAMIRENLDPDRSCPEWDFALLLLPEGVHQHVDPSIHGTTAPCGQYTDRLRRDVMSLGHGPRTNTAGPDDFEPAVPRAGIVDNWDTQLHGSSHPPEGTFGWVSLVRGGDSGSPVWMSGTGEAAGIATRIRGRESTLLGGPDPEGPRIDRIMYLLDTYSQYDWTLVQVCP